MSISNKKTGCITLMVLLVMLGGVFVDAATKTGKQMPFSIAFLPGFFLPGQQTVKDMYGSSWLNARGEISWNWHPGFSTFIAFSNQKKSGRTLSSIPGFSWDAYKLEINISAFEIGSRLDFKPGRNLLVFAGVSLGYNLIRENWPDLAVKNSINRLSPALEAGFRFYLNRRFFLVNLIRFTSISTGRGAYFEPEVNLGGLNLLLGAGYRL